MNKTVKRNDEKGIFLYILELQNGKYYVGITNNPEQRFGSHKMGQSVHFVKKNLPIIKTEKTLLRTRDRKRALKLESEKTIELIQKFGIENVCGGTIVGDYHERIGKFKAYMNRITHGY